MSAAPIPAPVPAPRRFVLSRPEALTAFAVAALAAIAVPGSRAGIGLAIVGLAVVASAHAASVDRNPWSAAALLVAGLLCLTPLLRDATWLVAANLTAALALCAAALVGGARWRDLLAGPSTLIARALPAPMAVARGVLAAAPSPGAGDLATVIRGCAIAALLVGVLAALLASADAVFAEAIQSISPAAGTFEGLPARTIAALVTAAIVGGLALTAGAPAPSGAPGPQRRLSPLEWAIPLAAVVVLLAAFSAVQAIALWGGNEHVLETAGLTYAEYAREGFGQLLAATILVLAVIGAARRHGTVTSRRQDLVMRALLTALGVLTLVVVASALARLDLYVDAFGATRARLLAAVACASLGALVALVTTAVLTGRSAWLPRTTLLGGALVLIALTAANPDALIAERNVERFAREGKIDLDYARALSADAVPALSELPPAEAAQALAEQRTRLSRRDGPFGLNVGRNEARTALRFSP